MAAASLQFCGRAFGYLYCLVGLFALLLEMAQKVWMCDPHVCYDARCMRLTTFYVCYDWCGV